uniref:Uncharacterized protein n=1 Tax=Anguilla anguilla TaxID=7936 RepID=A0A0E9RDN3_ANGAN
MCLHLCLCVPSRAPLTAGLWRGSSQTPKIR